MQSFLAFHQVSTTRQRVSKSITPIIRGTKNDRFVNNLIPGS